MEGLGLALREALDERDRLRALINTPIIDDFFDGVRNEMAHQVERWGTDHDAGKAPADWFWLVGYLAGKILAAEKAGDTNRMLHHTVSSAAVLANWFKAIKGADNRMRPGIADPEAHQPAAPKN